MCHVLLTLLCSFSILLLKVPLACLAFLALVAVPFPGTFITRRFARGLLILCCGMVSLFATALFIEESDYLVKAAAFILCMTSLSKLDHLRAHIDMPTNRDVYRPKPIAIQKSQADSFRAIEQALSDIEFENDNFKSIRWKLTCRGKERKFAFDDDRLEKMEEVTASTEAFGWKWEEKKPGLDYPKLDITAKAIPGGDGALQIDLDFDLHCESWDPGSDVSPALVKTTTDVIGRYLTYSVLPKSVKKFLLV